MATSNLPALNSLVTWRNLALLLALLNLKNLPFVWHLRILFHALWNLRSIDAKPRFSLKTPSIHPIFATHVLTTHTPLLEIDYNLHKSNSTYFTDLDASRTGLVFSLMSPGFKSGNAELEAQGHRGRFVVVLGSVHASFRREIQPYERYEVRSRLLGWDAKWLVVGSWFVKPAKGKKEGEEVLASALSKYVVKKGRFTVSPERGLIHAGLLPEKTGGQKTQDCEGGLAESKWEQVANGNANGHVDGLTTAAAPDALGRVVELDTMADVNLPEPAQAKLDTGTAEWDWDRVEKERLRGLELAKGWLALDAELLQEFSRVPGS
jgi:Thioesterase-like superfamily